MRDYFFGANWKMNMSIKDAIEFFYNWDNNLIKPNSTLVFFPTHYTLGYLQKTYGDKNLFGAQNITFYPKGAYTGESTPELLKADNIHYSLVGHSERREYFSETDQDIALKIQQNLKYQIKTVLCVGEPLPIREKNEHLPFIQNQIKQALDGISMNNSKDFVIAYEPIWAIGTGETANTQEIEEMHSTIRNEIKLYGLPSDDICIIYGGSVNAENAHSILSLPNVDGALIGGASLKPSSLQSIIESI